MLESCNATLSFNVYFLKTHALEACSATWLMLENCLTFVCVLGWKIVLCYVIKHIIPKCELENLQYFLGRTCNTHI